LLAREELDERRKEHGFARGVPVTLPEARTTAREDKWEGRGYYL